MKKSFYNNFLIFVLVLFDFVSNFFSISIISINSSSLSYGSSIFPELFFLAIYTQLFWSIIFLFFNLYDTKATLSRFDEIIKLFPIIYSSLIVYITMNVFGLIKINYDYKIILTYGLLFSSVLMVNRFFIHTIQKYLLKNKFGLNNAIILGLNRRGMTFTKISKIIIITASMLRFSSRLKMIQCKTISI